MKQKSILISGLLLFSTTLSSVVPAQTVFVPRSPVKTGPHGVKTIKAEPVKVQADKSVAAVMGEIQAYVDGANGAVINWQMDYELGNIGFNVYRMEDGGYKLVNDSLIGGSVLRAGEKKELIGQNYSAYDPQGRADTPYYIETLDLRGNKTLHGPVVPVFAPSITDKRGYDERLRPDFTGTDHGLIFQNLPSSMQPAGSTTAMKQASGVKGATRDTEVVAPDPVKQKWVASQPGVKIRVNKTGFYRITKTQLQTAGFDVNSAPANWQLYVNGIEQNINVQAAGDYIEFYGGGIDIENADFQMYYLIAGPAPGARIEEGARIPTGPIIVAPYFRNTTNFEPRSNYLSTDIVNGDLDNWFGPVITSAGPTTRTINIKDIDADSPDVTITAAVHGLTSVHHSVQFKINGSALDTLQFDGIVPFSRTYSIKASSIQNGANTVELTSLSGASDTNVLDHVTIEYWRQYRADQNALAFDTQQQQKTNLSNFTSSDVRVFELNDTTGQPKLITNALVTPGAGGTFDVAIPQGRKATMFALGDSALLSPVSITLNSPSTLSSTTSTADMLIISHGNFINEANTWATYRRSQGLTVDVAIAEDVFDEFDYGLPTPTALKSYILASKAANANLKYVMLIGDATYDPRNYLGVGYNDLIPTKFVDTFEGESPSDEFLADADGDGVAELAIGRLAVRDSASVTLVLNKVMSYESNLTANSLMTRGFVFVSDDPVGWDFVAMSHRLRDELPAGMPATFVDAPNEPNPAVIRQQIINAVNAGPLFTNYAGHGSTRVWSTRQFLRFTPTAPATNDLLGLNNSAGNKLTVFLMLTCLNGYFVDPLDDSIGEGVVRLPNGGAPTSWSSTGSTTPNIQEEMAVVFFDLLGQGTYERLGDATHAAKLNATSPEVPLTWAILGDPALKIK